MASVDDTTSIVSNRTFVSTFTCKNRRVWSEVEHWRDICPLLTINGKAPQQQPTGHTESSQQDLQESERRRRCLEQDAYVLANEPFSSAQSQWEALTLKLKNAIITLEATFGYPATFVMLFDETWELARLARQTLNASTHASNEFNFDILAWYISHRQDGAGFSPHRDRQPEHVSDSFHGDGQAKYVTMWTALSNATPENSCLYVIPKQNDPGYMEGDDNEDESKVDGQSQSDPLSRALPSKESYQNIRALPRQAGQSVLFTHRIMHWGSRGNPNSSEEPRIAISFVCSDPSFESPYISPKYFDSDQIPPFEIRMLLVCAQLLIYYQRFNLGKESVRACYEYCKEYQSELDETYRKKVFVEFVKAIQETKDCEESHVVSDGNKGSEPDARVNGANSANSDEDDDDEDAMLEEMLNAEEGGYGEFQDDYDELAGEENETIDSSSDSEEEEEGVALFGKRLHEQNSSDQMKKKAR